MLTLVEEDDFIDQNVFAYYLLTLLTNHGPWWIILGDLMVQAEQR